jgi:hypothetical protein
VAPVKNKETDTIGEIVFLRSNGKILGNVCHACKLPKTIDDKAYGLVIDMDSISLVLCNYHEGMLLERLLTNYLKRKVRPHTIGFVGPISKPTEEELNV